MLFPRLFNLFGGVALAAAGTVACSGAKRQACDYASPQFDPVGLARTPGYDSVPSASTGFVALQEASGAVPCSWDSTGIWVIEDGGTGPNLFLVHLQTGRVKAQLQLNVGWTNVDWEDLAHWTDSTGQRWLGIAEIGDNNAVYPTRAIYALHEPTGIDTVSGAGTSYTPVGTQTWIYVYADGPRDAESLFVDPVDGRLYVVSKRDVRNRVYALPAEPSTGLDTAKAVADLPLFMSTAADRRVLADGRAPLVIRSYGRLYYWEAEATETACAVLQRTPTELPYTDQEVQGEIIALLPDGSYVLLSEQVGTAAPKVQVYRALR